MSIKPTDFYGTRTNVFVTRPRDEWKAELDAIAMELTNSQGSVDDTLFALRGMVMQLSARLAEVEIMLYENATRNLTPPTSPTEDSDAD